MDGSKENPKKFVPAALPMLTVKVISSPILAVVVEGVMVKAMVPAAKTEETGMIAISNNTNSSSGNSFLLVHFIVNAS